MSALRDCQARLTPAPQVLAPQRVPQTRPTNVGGGLKPTDLRANPLPAVPSRAGPAPVSVGDVLPEGLGMPLAGVDSGYVRYNDASLYYEMGGNLVRVDPETREVIEVAPLGGGLLPDR